MPITHEQAYKNVTDHDIHFRVDLYPKEQRDAELHSILGTEVARLPAQLETYYSRYFEERSRVVAFPKQSRAEIEKQIALVHNYDQELTQLKKNIDQRTNQIIGENNQVSELRKRLKSIPADERTEEYNKVTEVTNTHTHEYNRLVVIYDHEATEYNATAAKRNSLASDTQDLIKTLDTRESSPKIK